MKHRKMLGLAAVAATALMAFVGVGTASATTLLGVGANRLPTGTTIHAVGEGTLTLTTAFKNIDCKEEAGLVPTVQIKTTNETGASVSGNVGILNWGKCNCEVKTLAKGTLSISVSGAGPNGTLSSNGAEVTSQCTTIFGDVHCIYKTSNTALGTLTGTNATGATATMDISSANIPRLSTDSLCTEKAQWDASYIVDNPDVLNVVP